MVQDGLSEDLEQLEEKWPEVEGDSPVATWSDVLGILGVIY